LRDLKTVLDILSINLLEHKDKKIYKDLTVIEVTQLVFDGLT
jgi:hypothetical protein